MIMWIKYCGADDGKLLWEYANAYASKNGQVTPDIKEYDAVEKPIDFEMKQGCFYRLVTSDSYKLVDRHWLSATEFDIEQLQALRNNDEEYLESRANLSNLARSERMFSDKPVKTLSLEERNRAKESDLSNRYNMLMIQKHDLEIRLSKITEEAKRVEQEILRAGNVQQSKRSLEDLLGF